MTDIVIDFSEALQGFGALQETAYRMLDRATVRFEQIDGGYRCHVTSKIEKSSPAAIRDKFFELLTDENIREKIEAKTTATRHLVLALAFGGLAKESDDKLAL